MPISHTLTLTALSPARCSRPTAPTCLHRPTFIYAAPTFLFTFPGLTPSGHYLSLKVPKISMVFLTYIVYVLLFAFPRMIPSGYYADDFLGFLRHTVYEFLIACPGRRCSNICFQTFSF